MSPLLSVLSARSQCGGYCPVVTVPVNACPRFIFLAPPLRRAVAGGRRRQEHLPAVCGEAIAVGAKTLWLQSGLWDDRVARDGEAAGLTVVMDRCLKVEYARFSAS